MYENIFNNMFDFDTTLMNIVAACEHHLRSGFDARSNPIWFSPGYIKTKRKIYVRKKN